MYLQQQTSAELVQCVFILGPYTAQAQGIQREFNFKQSDESGATSIKLQLSCSFIVFNCSKLDMSIFGGLNYELYRLISKVQKFDANNVKKAELCSKQYMSFDITQTGKFQFTHEYRFGKEI
ncbi:hypothetical protein BT96DRAFT_939877 [Gymnopus androsaceus JB14]|uniref:Uncharacterized protein n=1 Tax=Gymnopus androsaceus JB14 TaxID=1447944 RepID=A0A6A4HPW1_9AGAR|nr:hypothetical protein BT96DRAFT_939877 [Gymnopus androsaceus JB14]